MNRKTLKSILIYTLYALGAIFLLAALVGMIATGINAGTAFTVFVSVILLALAFFYDKLHLALRIGILSLLTLGILFAAFLPIYGSIDTVDHKEDAMIVLGAGLNGEEPSRALAFRLDAAYDYAMKNPSAIIVVSGGQGKNEVIPESLAMKRYLLKKGIAEERIIEENKSTSTKENLAFSKAILDETLGNDYRTVIITNDYHILRAESLAKKAGFSQISHTSGRTPLSIFIPCTLRECAAVIYYFLF